MRGGVSSPCIFYSMGLPLCSFSQIDCIFVSFPSPLPTRSVPLCIYENVYLMLHKLIKCPCCVKKGCLVCYLPNLVM